MNTSKTDVLGLVDRNTMLEGEFKLVVSLPLLLSVLDQRSKTDLIHASYRYLQTQGACEETELV